MFTGKNVVITAAAGNVGRNLVEKFHSAGAVVIAADINEIRKLGLPFLLVLRGSIEVKNDVRERSKLRKARRSSLFPTDPDRG